VEFLPDSGHGVPSESGETMSRRLRNHTPDFKAKVGACRHQTRPAEQFDVHPNQINRVSMIEANPALMHTNALPAMNNDTTLPFSFSSRLHKEDQRYVRYTLPAAVALDIDDTLDLARAGNASLRCGTTSGRSSCAEAIDFISTAQHIKLPSKGFAPESRLWDRSSASHQEP
jgi:hypothetical protein